MATSKYKEITFSDEDVVDPRDYIPLGEYNPHNVRPWLLHDHGFVVAVVFADSLQEALDKAVDEDKLDRYLLATDDILDYPNEEGITFLGNASEAFDIESLQVEELSNPAFSFCSLFNSHQEKGK